ncbi:MAG: tRNA (adenosine(37)-N6)-dimethylallyltransferase MiaA [Clostridia bacterium]|nr:tRNA (adenosine(37)-N6)-dimethylallyltransferase MiaA [Clostridia bacterium]
MKPTVLFIVGPTASGKTDAAVEAALRLNGEVISADAIQIYRELNVGSAKPTKEEMRGVAHHLLGFLDYRDGSYNAARFAKDASRLIREISARGRLPVVAGGTGLYVNSLLYPLDFTAAPPDPRLREALEREEDASPGSLHKRLTGVDPASAARLHPNDRKRVIRALEVYETTGRTLTSHGGDFLNERREEIPFYPVIVRLEPDRAVLYERIGRRVDAMLENGLEEEVMRLWRGCGGQAPLSLQGIGYRQFICYFEGEATRSEAVLLIKRDTRRYAKRQVAWFKREQRARGFDPGAYPDRAALYDGIVEYFIEEAAKYGRDDQE